MTRLFSEVFCSKWRSPPKRFCGVFPKQFCTFVWESPGVFGVNGCCFKKGSVEGSRNYSLHLSPTWLCFIIAFWRVPPTALYIYKFISQSPLGVKVEWIVDMSQPYKSRPQKPTHHVIAVGVVFGITLAVRNSLETLQCWSRQRDQVFEFYFNWNICMVVNSLCMFLLAMAVFFVFFRKVFLGQTKLCCFNII